MAEKYNLVICCSRGRTDLSVPQAVIDENGKEVFAIKSNHQNEIHGGAGLDMSKRTHTLYVEVNSNNSQSG